MFGRPKRHTIGPAALRTEEQLSTEGGALHQRLPCVWVKLQERKRSAARLANKLEEQNLRFCSSSLYSVVEPVQS